MGLSGEDRALLADLVDRYAALVDQRRFEELLDLFADDAVLTTADPPRSLDPVTPHRGRAGILSAMSPLAGFESTFHAVVGRTADAGAARDEATGRVTCVAHHVGRNSRGETCVLVWYLHYDDSYVREGDVWLFRTRAMTVHRTEVRRPD